MKKRTSKLLIAVLMTVVFAVTGTSSVSATVADYYDPGFNRVGGVFVNSAGAPIPGAMKRGIDVSYHQGAIDWNAVAASDIQFAFVRAGSFKSGLDACFRDNMSGAIAAGIPVGIYVYSYAVTPEMAAQEALFAISCAKDYPVSYPIAYDIEDNFHKGMTAEQLNALIDSFCTTVQNAGYYPIVYSSKNWFTSRIGAVSHDTWVAQYGPACTYPGYSFWQATSHGYVNGVAGRVDLNFQFKDYSSVIIGNGFKTVNGKTFFMENYMMHRGWLDYNGKRYYMEPLLGVMQTGLFAVDGGIYYFGTDGAMMTGLVKIGADQYYFDPTTGAMMTNTTIKIGKKNYLIDVLGVVHAAP